MRTTLLLFCSVMCEYYLCAQDVKPVYPKSLTLGNRDTILQIPFAIDSANTTGTYIIRLSHKKNSSDTTAWWSILNDGTKLKVSSDKKETLKLCINFKLLGSHSDVVIVPYEYQRNNEASKTGTIRIEVAYQESNPALPSLYQAYAAKLTEIDAKYNCDMSGGDIQTLLEYKKYGKAVQTRLLDTNLIAVFSTVALGGNDILKTGTAASIVQDNDKGTLSFNKSFPIGDMSRTWPKALNVGLSANSSGKIFNLFSGEGWSKEVGLNAGFSMVGRGTQMFDSEDCYKLRKKRDTLYSRLLTEYAATLSEPIDDLRSKIAQLDRRLSYTNLMKEPITKKVFETLSARRKALQDRIDKYDKLYIKYPDSSAGKDKIKDNIENDLFEFERTNDILTGYKFAWFDTKIGFAHKLASLNTDSVKSDELKKMISKESLIKFSAQASINFTLLTDYKANQKGLLFFGQENFLLERGSFLDVPGVTGTPIVSTKDSTNIKIINPDNSDTLGLERLIKRPVWSFTPGIYLAVFWGKGQQIGWDIRATYRMALNQIEGSSLQNSFSIFTGPVFRIAGEKDFSKATIGLKAGLANAPQNTSRLWKDYFSLRLEVGVPFKWYYK